MSVNLEKEKWFLEQINKGELLIFRDGTIKNKSGKVIGAPHYSSNHNRCKLHKLNSNKYIAISKYEKTITDKNGKKKKIIHQIMAHRLVWITFNGLITDPELEINHIDGNKTNNSLSNLELCARGTNLKHAIDNRLTNFKGGLNPAAKFKDKEVIYLREQFQLGKCTVKDIANYFNVSTQTVNAMLNKKTYSHI